MKYHTVNLSSIKPLETEALYQQLMSHFHEVSDQDAVVLRKRQLEHQESVRLAHASLQEAGRARIGLKLKGKGIKGKRHYMPNFGGSNPLQRLAA